MDTGGFHLFATTEQLCAKQIAQVVSCENSTRFSLGYISKGKISGS